jgi:hypothetical protein
MYTKYVRSFLVLVFSMFLISALIVSNAQAVALNSVVLSNGNEYDTTLLTFSLGETGDLHSVASEFYENIGGGQFADIYNFNYLPTGQSTSVNVYVTSSDFTYAMGETGYNTEAAIQRCVDYSPQYPSSKLVTLYPTGDTFSLLFQGTTIISQDSSLEVGRYAQGYSPDILTEWKASNNPANASNPIGQIKYTFEKDLDKTSINNIRVYLNDSATEPAFATEIKTLLFEEFVDRNLEDTAANELTADIFRSFNDLKDDLTAFNGGTAVTKVRIVGKATDGTDTSFTINIE